MGVGRCRGGGALKGSRRALFFDRDGVLNEPVSDPFIGTPESPLDPDRVVLAAGAIEAVATATAAGFRPVIITNQPSAAKGRVTEATLDAVNDAVLNLLAAGGSAIEASFMCKHHPDGTVGGLAMRCTCRKPGAGLLVTAAQELGLDLADSWMVGDTDADVGAARNAGLAGIQIVCHPLSAHRRTAVVASADGRHPDLMSAVNAIVSQADAGSASAV